MRLETAVLSALLLAATLAGSARAEDYYFVLVFGSQSPDFNPNGSHSFATFVHTRGTRTTLDTQSVELVTISWLPEDGSVEVLRALPERGRNWGLHETMRMVLGQGQQVSLWGPYQIGPDLYHRAVAQAAHLASGAVRYKCVDLGFPGHRVSNCIHAVDAALPGAPLRLVGYGVSASYQLTRKILPWVVGPERTHDWLIGRLGLQGYPVVRRGPPGRPVAAD